MKSEVVRDQRAIAYIQFLDNKTMMEIINKSKKDVAEDQEYIKAKSLYNSARFRLLIFGGKEIVEALADFSYSSGDDFRKATTRLFQAMRHDLRSECDYLNENTIKNVL